MRNKIYGVLLIVVAFFLFYAGSCSSYHIEGYIAIDRNEIGLNDTLYMEAIVTDEIQPYDVVWMFSPVDADADLVFPLPDDPENNKYKALFVAREKGEYQISICFLYKNTAPKDSDTVFVKVK